MKLGHVALDGTKVKANASKHKAMSYQRMKEKAAQLAAEVAELLRQAQAADDEEDRRYGKDKRGDELPEELAFRERRLEKIREAMAALEAEAQAAAEQAEAEGGKPPGVPDDKAQRNFKKRNTLSPQKSGVGRRIVTNLTGTVKVVAISRTIATFTQFIAADKIAVCFAGPYRSPMECSRSKLSAHA